MGAYSNTNSCVFVSLLVNITVSKTQNPNFVLILSPFAVNLAYRSTERLGNPRVNGRLVLFCVLLPVLTRQSCWNFSLCRDQHIQLLPKRFSRQLFVSLYQRIMQETQYPKLACSRKIKGRCGPALWVIELSMSRAHVKRVSSFSVSNFSSLWRPVPPWCKQFSSFVFARDAGPHDVMPRGISKLRFSLRKRNPDRALGIFIHHVYGEITTDGDMSHGFRLLSSAITKCVTRFWTQVQGDNTRVHPD